MYKKYHYLCEDAKKIREDVFIKEQGFSNEFDETDKFATHLVFYEEETPIGVCRYFKGERNLEYVIGRIAVQKESRGKHFGKWIIETAEDNIRKEGGKIVTLSAQLRVQSFYEKMGYVASGKPYLDEFCFHIHMEKELEAVTIV